MNTLESNFEIIIPGVIRFPGKIDQSKWIDLIENVSKTNYNFLEVERRPHLTMELPTWFSKNDNLDSINLRSMFLLRALPAITTYMNIYQISNMQSKKNFITVSKLMPNLSMTEHKDNYDENSKHFICMMYVNDNFLGGELILKEHSITYKPSAGDIMIYKANMLHEVLPSDGTRYSIGYGLTE